MNELPATVGEGDSVQVAGTAVAVPDARTRERGESINLLVRPEDVRLSGDDNGGLPGTVVSRTFQGASSVVTTRLDVLDTLGVGPRAGHRFGVGRSRDPGARGHRRHPRRLRNRRRLTGRTTVRPGRACMADVTLSTRIEGLTWRPDWHLVIVD